MVHPGAAGVKRVLATAAALVFCVSAAVAQQDRPPTPVTVVTLETQDVTLTSTLPGRVVASGVAEVRPQVAGIITERLFDEGAEVAMGDALYQIDAATYSARVAAAEAAVAQARARLSAARKEAERLLTLKDRQIVAEQNVDSAVADRDAAAATLQVAQAELKSAQIDLDRTTVRAPLSGVVGRSLTTQGALVTAAQAQPLTVIRSLDPAFVDVTQSAAELIRWQRGLTEADLGAADRTVTLTLADGTVYEQTGHLAAAEANVDELTGVVVLRMEFPNPDRLLLPGMYVQVEMPQGEAKGVILVPHEAVRRDRRGRPTALVVNDENVVENRDLTVIRDRGNDWIVSGGLEDGARVIVEGVQKIGVGATVAPEERAAAPAPAQN
ncbi:efflux RND transporter periplasmic adaptor subunit [Maritimibacter sp. 55A14]|uniref:efflux RND transporter periplasmic adaptor subunit n=1 Tax=Maritimibacter sp. 55A14 TaxID=2174844 RepID=UPI000D60B252|nr:efflux RND transporter periplasmic adaptor subunit [Maritimibacter sp. 55A14]PWE33551.1 efflux RND transporter periplasmic adaptor subunit [Maritimibacter sp. 55A14]